MVRKRLYLYQNYFDDLFQPNLTQINTHTNELCLHLENRLNGLHDILRIIRTGQYTVNNKDKF